MPVMILDPILEQKIRADRDRMFPNNRDEVWDGVLVVPPLPNIEHQIMVTDLALAGANVSDRDADWTSNYREPDVVVYLATNPAKNSGTHWVGGPDLAVEVASPGEDPRLKFDFYAKVGTREVLIVDRDPWALEMCQLQGGKMALAGTSDAAGSAVLSSTALPLTFQLRSGAPRPVIHIAHTATGQTWTA